MSDEKDKSLETQEVKPLKKPHKKPSLVKRTPPLEENQTEATDPTPTEETASDKQVPLESLQTVEEFRTQADQMVKQLNVDEIVVKRFEAGLKLGNDLQTVERLISIRTYVWDRLNNPNVDKMSIKLFNPMVALLDKKIAVLLGTDEFLTFLSPEPK